MNDVKAIPEALLPLLPKPGSVWHWEPTKPAPVHRVVRVTGVRWNGEEAFVESEPIGPCDCGLPSHQDCVRPRCWNDLSRWMEATVFLGAEDDPTAVYGDRTMLTFQVVVNVNPERADPKDLRSNSFHPLRRPFVEGAWAIGTLHSLDVFETREWYLAEMQAASAESDRAEAAGYQRCHTNMVDPAHSALDNCEPAPPTHRVPGDEKSRLTPAARIDWLRCYWKAAAPLGATQTKDHDGVDFADEMLGVRRHVAEPSALALPSLNAAAAALGAIEKKPQR